MSNNKPENLTEKSAESMKKVGHTFIKTEAGVNVDGFVLKQPKTLAVPSQETVYGPTQLLDPRQQAQDAAQEPTLEQRVDVVEKVVGTLPELLEVNNGLLEKILDVVEYIAM